jgi:hypothetical protein
MNIITPLPMKLSYTETTAYCAVVDLIVAIDNDMANNVGCFNDNIKDQCRDFIFSLYEKYALIHNIEQRKLKIHRDGTITN